MAGATSGKVSGGEIRPGDFASNSLPRHISTLSIGEIREIAHRSRFKNQSWTNTIQGPIASRDAFLQIKGVGPKWLEWFEEQGIVLEPTMDLQPCAPVQSASATKDDA